VQEAFKGVRPLINNHPVDGVATDISQKSLQDAPYVLSMLDYDQYLRQITADSG
jgi:hypothetical protein